MTKFSGSFSTTDKDATIRPKKDPIDEVIDILTAPSRPAPVNVGMMPERRGNVNIPMGQSTFVNVPGRPGEEQAQTPLNVASPFTTALNLDPDMFDQDTGDIINYPVGGGRGGPFDGGNFLTSIPANFGIANVLPGNFAPEMMTGMNPQSQSNIPPQISKASSMPPQNLIDQINPTGLQGILQGLVGSVTGSSPAIYNLTDEYGDPLGGDNFAVGRKFDNPDTARRLGFIPVGRDAGGNIVYDVDPAVKASQERQDRDSRLDDERAERAAMLAAQQQQPVDPCPEGYRMDPVSKVCVPTDDTTEPDNITPRTYDTMTRPEPNYTPATNFNIPAITLPDILTGN